MLYFLESADTEKAFYLINREVFIVGRKNCDILIDNDSSISRLHAKLRIKENLNVTVEDLKSKYKTFINDKEMDPNVEVQLNDKDTLQFGVLHSKFTFRQMKLVTTATQLSPDQKDTLTKQLILLQGKYMDHWSSECTHVTLERVTLTVKVLLALLEDKPIVLPGFWKKFVEHVSKNLRPPNIADYNDPPLAEALLNKVEFKNTVERKGIFNGKTFLFLLEKEKKQVEELIEKAGGIAISWEKKPLELKQITQSPQEFILMQSNKDIDDKSYQKVIDHFSKQNKRMIPVPEIPMAILHGSCKKDCNPNFNRGREVFKASKHKEPTQHNPLVYDTESPYVSGGSSSSQRIIPETIDVDQIDILEENHRAEEIEEILKPTETTKRTGGGIDEQNPCKKAKLDKDKVKMTARLLQSEDKRKTESSNEKNEGYLSKGFKSQKRSQVNDNKSESISQRKEMEENPFIALKRKYAEITHISDSEDEPPNPFLIYVKKKRTEETPFGNRTSSSGISSENPLLSIIEESQLLSSTRREDRSTFREEPVYYSKISRKSSDNDDSTWLSKSTLSDQIKEKEEMDTEEQKFVSLFKDTIVVEVLSNLSIRSRPSSDELDGTNNSNVKNFKKFKKVKPLHPQTTIISRHTVRATSGVN